MTRLWTFLKEIAARYPALLALNAALLLLAALTDGASVVLIAPVIDLLTAPDLAHAASVTRRALGWLSAAGVAPSLRNVLLLFVGFNMVKALFQTAAWNLIARTKYAVLRDLTIGSFDDFLKARWSFFTENSQGTMINTFIRELGNVGSAFTTIGHLLMNLLQLALYLAVPLWLSWPVTLVSLAAALAAALPFFWLGQINYRLGRRTTAAANRMGAVLQENLGLAKAVLGFGNQAKGVASLRDAFEELRRSSVMTDTLNLATPTLYHPLGFLVVTCALLAARRLGVPLSETAVLFYALAKIVPIIASLAEKKNGLEAYLPGWEQVRGLRARAKELEHRGGGRLFAGLREELRFDRVSFAHPGREPIIHDLSARIPKGRMTAFVGESGAGKTTLVDLLIGLLEPSSGRVLIDGVPLPELDALLYRRRLGYVGQDSLLFNLSVRDNLLWAKEDASEAELWEACRQANAEAFVRELPRGLDSGIGDRGVRLSGGQLQRLALARAILRRPELLLLDEATSSLDSESERGIQQAIDAIARERHTTIVVIAHRLSTIVNADAIHVLKAGRVVEQGGYQELLSRRGAFSRMAELQALESARPS